MVVRNRVQGNIHKDKIKVTGHAKFEHTCTARKKSCKKFNYGENVPCGYLATN